MEDYTYISQIITQCIITELGCTDFVKDEANNLISFTYHSLSYICIYDAKDPYYLRIIIPNIDMLNQNTENKYLHKILELNAKFKTGKFITVENALWVVAEIMLTGVTRVTQTFVDLVNLLEHMRSEYAMLLTAGTNI
ncbi:MAG: hypothetical protein J6S09_06095 [Paludibacteraceae bacterium]|nr:hypothetical protein [Paludibacteraceae bacterium]